MTCTACNEPVEVSAVEVLVPTLDKLGNLIVEVLVLSSDEVFWKLLPVTGSMSV
jgi:hypothetical protein